MEYQIRNNTLQVGNRSITFQHSILNAAEAFSMLIVVLNIPDDCDETENLCAVNSEGEIVWQIAPREEANAMPITGASVTDDDRLLVRDWSGRRYFVDPKDGAILGRDRNGREW